MHYAKKILSQPLLMRAAREQPLGQVGYHYDREKRMNVFDGSTTPVVSVTTQLLKSTGAHEDIS